jgi:hypothetical protein
VRCRLLRPNPVEGDSHQIISAVRDRLTKDAETALIGAFGIYPEDI